MYIYITMCIYIYVYIIIFIYMSFKYPSKIGQVSRSNSRSRKPAVSYSPARLHSWGSLTEWQIQQCWASISSSSKRQLSLKNNNQRFPLSCLNWIWKTLQNSWRSWRSHKLKGIKLPKTVWFGFCWGAKPKIK